MGNRVGFQLTAFIDLDDGIVRSGRKSWGYRLYDDLGQTCDNTFEEAELGLITPQKAVDMMAQDDDLYQYYSLVITAGGFYFNERWIEVDQDGQVQE